MSDRPLGGRMQPGLVSIVMPAYNSEEWLADAVESVFAQAFRAWELLIVADTSRDRTLEVARRRAADDPRIRVIHVQGRGGRAHARNVGMDAARGRYLAFLDSDDRWLPEKLGEQTDFMNRNDIGFSFAGYRHFRADGYLGPVVRVPEKIGYQALLKGNVIGNLTVMIDRQKIQIPAFQERTTEHEDYRAWLHILRRGELAWGLQRDLARYRVSLGQCSASKGHQAACVWKLYREIERLPLPKAAWCFAHYSCKGISKHYLRR
jgi:teichuronic acid biosynthesis glycosyltransferase TuaG